jgi:hypothetical protein
MTFQPPAKGSTDKHVRRAILIRVPAPEGCYPDKKIQPPCQTNISGSELSHNEDINYITSN